jgi:copper(I)-binding protein
MNRALRQAVICLLIAAAPLVAHAEQNGIKIENAWSRAAMAGRTGVVYLTVTDSGGNDRLVSVTSPVATEAMLHESFTDHGVAKMRPVATLQVAPGQPITLAPGGYHIMLMGLKQPLKPGDTFPLMLKFDQAGQVTTTVTVRKAGAAASDTGTMGDMPMQGNGTTAKPP